MVAFYFVVNKIIFDYYEHNNELTGETMGRLAAKNGELDGKRSSRAFDSIHGWIERSVSNKRIN